MGKAFKGKNRKLIGGVVEGLTRAAKAKTPEEALLRGALGFVEGADAQSPHQIKARVGRSDRNKILGDLASAVIDGATKEKKPR